MKTIKFSAIIFTIILINSCVPLKEVTVVKNDNIARYKYVFITPTNSVTSSQTTVSEEKHSTTTKSINPSDVITGILLKEGFVRLPELKPELLDETLIVNYGESGRRSTGLGGGYTIEVTIQLISAKSHNLISSCTAEGQGKTEADDIRIAITRCLSSILSE